jgi:hypothetical protein
MGLDLTRSHLLARELHKTYNRQDSIPSFDQFPLEIQERITYSVGDRYQYLANWINSAISGPDIHLDHFLIRLFGEVLSQPGFGFHNDFDKSEISNRIIESVRNFRHCASSTMAMTPVELGVEYFNMVKNGVFGNQYIRSWTLRPLNAVFLAPAYTFLLSNVPVEYQFWLDVGSRGWYERIYQPLTNPYVLNRDWDRGSPWRDVEELKLNQDNLANIVRGLIHRCKVKIYFCLTETDERGFDQNGLLIQALHHTIRAIETA